MDVKSKPELAALERLVNQWREPNEIPTHNHIREINGRLVCHSTVRCYPHPLRSNPAGKSPVLQP
jgi:hypothetical protein